MAKKPKKVDLQHITDRICKELLKRRTVMAPTNIVPPKQRATRARKLYAQLAMAHFGADPSLV